MAGEGAGQSATGSVCDMAGNCSDDTVSGINIDLTAPMSAHIAFPVEGVTYYLDSEWSAGCDPASAICGTATDEGDVVSGVDFVEISIQQVASGLYWDGDGFDSADEVEFVADGGAEWLESFAYANFTEDGEYAVRARATDGAGNKESTAVVHFFVEALEYSWVSGGGKIIEGNRGNGKPDWTFGGVAGYVEGGTAGQFQLIDHRDGATNPCHYTVDSYSHGDGWATFTASLKNGSTDYCWGAIEVTTFSEISASAKGKDKNRNTIAVAGLDEEGGIAAAIIGEMDPESEVSTATFHPENLDGGNFRIHSE